MIIRLGTWKAAFEGVMIRAMASRVKLDGVSTSFETNTCCHGYSTMQREMV